MKIKLPVLIILIACLLAGCINFSNGPGSDTDAGLVIIAAKALPDVYIPSRSWGNPAYEVIVYNLYYLFHTSLYDSTAMQLYGIVCLIAVALLLYACLLKVTKGNTKVSLAATLSFLAFPVTIANSNVVMETMQGVALALAAFYFFLRSLKEGKHYQLVLIAVFAGLATATRLDYIMFATALGLVVYIYKNPDPLTIAECVAVYLAVAFSPWFIYHDFDFMRRSVVTYASLSRKAIRAAIGFTAFWGLPVFAYFGYFFLRKLPRVPRTLLNYEANPVPVFVLLAYSFYLPRYLMLPDELEYILVLLPLGILLFSMYATLNQVVLAGLLAFIPNLVQVYFIKHETFGYKFSPGIAAGAIWQESTIRESKNFETAAKLSTSLLTLVHEKGYKHMSQNLDNLDNPDFDCMVVASSVLHTLNSDRMLYPNIKKTKKPIFYYPLNASDKCWRTFVQPETFDLPNRDNFKQLDVNLIP